MKTRLQSLLSRRDAERFGMAALLDTLESAAAVVARPVLFLVPPHEPASEVQLRLVDAGLDAECAARIRIESQRGQDLGERLENAFAWLCADAAGRGAFVLGADSPALDPAWIRAGSMALERSDVVLGPTADGGYWSIGVRRPIPGLLRGIEWSTPATREQTLARIAALELRCELLAPWTDVDEPRDLDVLAGQIAAARRRGDRRVARHSECFLAGLS